MWVKPVVRFSAPGSLMIMGEHAVLQGYLALVGAIDKRVTVEIHPRKDFIISIISDLGNVECPLSHLVSRPPLQFVFAVIHYFKKRLPSGCTIIISSAFSATVGLASSAAVTTALFAAFAEALGLSYSHKQLIYFIRRIIQSVQGIGSGADAAACVMGGVISYSMKPLQVKSLMSEMPLTVFYSGYKTSTVEVLSFVKKKFEGKPLLFKHLIQSIGLATELGVRASINNNTNLLGEAMNIQQGIMAALGVSPPLLTNLVEELRSESAIMGAKISGSGLGDCVIGLGEVRASFQSNYEKLGVYRIMTKITPIGVINEKA